MANKSTIRDSGLIDAVEALNPISFRGNVWRVVREGRDPCQCNASGGRWDDTTFDVLYASKEREGAIAEMHFHLSRGQPVFPSKLKYNLHELSISLVRALHIPNLDALASLGLDISRYGQLSYNERVQEYLKTQEIAEAAHFLDFDGIIVPNARWNCSNVVLFCDRIAPIALEIVRNHGAIDWSAWQKATRAR